VCVFLYQVGFAQEPQRGVDEQAAAEVAALERSAADRGLSLREREAAADKAIELRSGLIAGAAENEARLGEWLTEQGGALLSRLARDGSDTAVLFGLPTPAQRELVGVAASEAADALARAARLSAGDDEDGGVRIPFYRARAAVLLAALSAGEERARHAEAALTAIGKTGLSNPGPEAARRVNVAAGLLMRAHPPAPADAQMAVEEFAYAAMGGDDPAKPSPAISGVTRAEGWLGLLHAARALGNLEAAVEQLRGAMSRAPFVVDARADPLLAVQAADATTRVLFEEGLARGDRGLLDRAVEEQMALLRRQDLGFRADVLRPGALEKLAELADRAGTAAVRELPAMFELARAIRTARQAEGRAEAIAAFGRIAERGDAGAVAGDAMWEWAVLLLQGQAPAEEQLAAVRVLTRLAREQPRHARGQEALSAALSYGRTVAGGREAYFEALRLATEHFPDLPEIELWRYERGRLALEGERPREDEVRGALESLRRDGSAKNAEGVRLQERLQTVLLDMMRSRVRAALASEDWTISRRIAREELEPEAGRAVEWARGARSSLLARFQADLADAMTEAGRSDGAPLYQALLEGGAEAVPTGVPRVRLGLARALLNAGDAKGAFGHLREVAAGLDGPASAEGMARVDDFWHAWTLMLELLGAESAGSPERAGAIRAHIRRLESIDPEVGGEPWKRRISAVKERVG
jgi:hypothetical protein